MRKTIAAALSALTLLAVISPAEARWRHRDRVIIEERTTPVLPLLGTLLTAQIITNMMAPPPQQIEPFAAPRSAPRYDDPNRKSPSPYLK
jgi:hypothetical protein